MHTKLNKNYILSKGRKKEWYEEIYNNWYTYHKSATNL